MNQQRQGHGQGQSPSKTTGRAAKLDKSLPSGSVPKFNPHGPQAPPQLKEQPYRSPPKVTFFFLTSQQYKKSPKKKFGEDENNDYTQFDIELILTDSDVNFRDPEKAPGGWLPLEAYDNKDYDTKTPQGWMESGVYQGKYIPMPGKGLWKDKDGLQYWRKLHVTKYFPKSDRFEVIWDGTSEKSRLNRIFILFEKEDPRLFAKRFKDAYVRRTYADSLIKYNYFIENMPTHEIPEVDTEQINRILTLTQNTKSLRGKSSTDTTTLLNEINFDFAKTMNKIIFDKHMKEKGNELITGSLKLPPKPKVLPPPQFGMISIPPYNFPNSFTQFCFNSLYAKNEVILAMGEIRKECNDVLSRDIYNPNITKTMRIEEFKQIQASSISQTSYYLRETWVNKLKEIIKINFADTSKAPWFNLQETSRETYEMGKLKKFLTTVKFMMQDTLLFLTKKSVSSFVDSVMQFLPDDVEIIDAFNVRNTFPKSSDSVDEDDPFSCQQDPIPLFQIDLMLEDDALMPEYSIKPLDVVITLMLIFDNGLKALQEITQLEQKLLPHLFKTNTKMFLKSTFRPDMEPALPDPDDKRLLPDENIWVCKEYTRLREALDKAVIPLNNYLQIYAKYEKEYKLNTQEYIKKQAKDEDDPPDPLELKADVQFHFKEEQRLKQEIPEHITVSIFQVNCNEMRNSLSGKHRVIAEAEIELIAKTARNRTRDLVENFETMHMKIEASPKDIEELTQIKDYMATIPNDLQKIQAEINNCMAVYDILDDFSYKFADDDDYDNKWKVFRSPKETLEKIEKQTQILEKEKEKFIAHMNGEQTEFAANINELEAQVSQFSQHQDINQYEEVASIARTINARMEAANQKARVFNNREMLTGMQPTDYSQLQLLGKDFKPYSDLWLTVHTWKKNHASWLNDEWEKLDALDLENIVDTSNKTMSTVIRFFREKDFPGILKIGETIKQAVEHFKPFVPLALALRKEGMKDRHWEQISNKVGFEVKPVEGFTFQTVMDMELINHCEDLVEIGERAAKEYNIECNLNKMKEDWESILFNLIPFKKTGTFSVTGFDDAMQILDEHIMTTQAMQFSPFKKPFEEDIEEWNSTLLYVTDTIDEWVRCQGQWMYLQPIFDSPDIMKQLPSENKKFKSVDKTWKEIISGTKANPSVLKACTREGLLEKFKDANNLLEVVQKGLKDYLESKRSIFARFYFLSNDELLEILSQTKEVENVRPHLRKVFENMADLEFHRDKTIHAMFSGEGEKINYVEAVDPKEKGVEYWMGEVERMMFKSVRNVLYRSITHYKEVPRPDWIKVHAGQCILNGSQVHWTNEVEEAIKKGPKGVSEYYDFLGDQLGDSVKLVREKLTKLQSITLGALIVIDVHAKGVIEKLRDEQIDDVDAFEWISQLRYYWENDDCRVKCVQTDFPYGYEYLGNTLRLVITPLTDKCYMTLMGALKLNLGGAPAGPAGTGKTESTKDLAKALAKQCVVFNCSDGMDYIMIGKFFKGLASAGAWCCFDEFNRINIEVLSVIAQQLLQLFGAKETEEPEIDFEGSVIKMKPTFCVFITMNPGYAGRTELPDNLKALFRPVAMMVPDYALIAEIMLYSFGFTNASILSKKMVSTFKLSSEQLSSQDHYDYGMRAVRSVINAAGLLKRQFQDMNEDQLLLRALRDVNVPKFLKDDIPLFENIISDLFPGVDKPVVDRGALMDQLQVSCQHYNLQTVDVFLEKIIQLYDTIQVRHGLMIVGPTGGGKTMNYKVLAHSMSALSESEYFEKVHYQIVNPKSITMGQLYGEVDPQTTEWIDGVLAKIVADMARDPGPDKMWIMLDGPVDAIWIENMNTVLDDNKKLCLNSGQIITLTERMTMMFEVEDLAVASPATVSRCGMVYMEPYAMGLAPLIKSWLNTLPPSFKLKKSFIPNLQKMIDHYLEPAIKFIRKNCSELVETRDNNICQSLMRILDCYFADYFDTELKKVTAEEIENLETFLESLFCFALTWSIGCTTNLTGRQKFNSHLRSQMKDSKMPFPSDNDAWVYDFCFNQEKKEWVSWLETRPPYECDAKKNTYLEMIVPTFDSIRYKYLMKLLITNKKHVLTPGPTGTGKTVNINELITSELPEEYQCITVSFSAQTSANQTQDGLDEKFEKRRKGVYGPAPGKRFVIFVDDLNMPKKEEYGAQPPIELLRQWMDHDGWYDRKSKEKSFMKIEDIILVSAMGKPGGGRTFLTKRLERHFNIITYTDLKEDSIKLIFGTIAKAFLADFSEDIKSIIDPVNDMTLRIYNKVATELKPTPSKSHYTFNLRDISKIFQGICSAYQKACLTKEDLLRLWIHENHRVFGDRMTNEIDRGILNDLLESEIKNTLSIEKESVYNAERILFGDYMGGIDQDFRPYQQISDLKQLVSRIEEYLEDLNSGSKTPMKLVMFLDACDHVSRICRVLRQPQGNSLLLGVGGSGRQSLTKVASYMMNYKIYQIEVVKGYNMPMWRDNLKSVLMQAGVDGKPTTFIFVDTQIINEQMVEDINNVLNSGDVPGLYKNEDFESIYTVGKTECLRKNLQLSKMNMFSCYLNRVKANIHCVLAMSPLGEPFRRRLRMFPSLVNCCTIDWFAGWPEEALKNVAIGSFSDGTIELGKDFDGCVEMCKNIHQSVEKISLQFLNEMRRQNYVTPTSYLELLSTYKSVLTERTKFFGDAKTRLERGLQVLEEAGVEVANLQVMLDAKKPELEKTKIEVEKTKKVIAEETEAAEETKTVVAADEAEASAQEAEVSKVRNEADNDLAEALPALDKAIKLLESLKVDDFYELKAMRTPTRTVVAMFEVCCYMMNLPKPRKPNDPKVQQYDPDGYFDLAQKRLLSEPKKFLESLKTYDRENIPDQLVNKVKPFMQKEEVQYERVEKASKALCAVHIWVGAMLKYHEVLKIVNPKREIVARLNDELAVVRANLNEKRAKLKAVNDRIGELEANFKAMVEQEKALQQEIEECGKKLIRAEKMIGGLEGEKTRWTETVKQLGEQSKLLVGDCLVAAGMVAYSGAFTSQYRTDLEESWRKGIDENKIIKTDNITMRQVLGDEVMIRIWQVAGLPSDGLSTENGIIIFKSRRWPLMIDPQTQANKFIKNLGRDVETGMEVFKPSEPNLARQLELAIQFGKWVLLEGVGQSLDPTLEPILLQQKIKSGSGYTIKLGDKTISYNESFRFFMTTTIPNPHYSPETQVKVTVLNFAITQVGLEEQMLNQFVGLEMPELQEKKNQIVEDNAKSAKTLREIEDAILHGLTKNENIADILNSDELIEILDASKKTSDEIGVRMKESEITEKEIDQTRESYRPVAYRASLLFFCIVDLSSIDPMYQYSLQWFQLLFSNAVNQSNPSSDVQERIQNLNSFFTFYLYENVCRSLFETHKLLFSYMLTMKILFGDNKVDMNEWRFFLAGATGDAEFPPNPTDWLDDLEWNEVYKQLNQMSRLPCLNGMEDYFMEYHKRFKKIFDSPNPHEEPMPGDWNDKLNSFQKMIVLKAIRPDMITYAVFNYIIEHMGREFIEPPTFDLSKSYRDSAATIPLIFVLSAGSNPVADFMKFSEEMEMTRRMQSISLGQGQDKKAEKMILEEQQRGGWVLLQNCHLALSWMPKLEIIVENLNDQIAPDFRMWMTSMPNPKFPVSTLQNSVKMTLEPPQGLKANMLRSYAAMDNREINDCQKPEAFKKLLFGFCFFHAIVQDRRKFGPIGWNIPYAFTNEDLTVCKKQLKIFLDTYDVVPYKVLNYLGSEINYGGRVTDDKDVRLIISILEIYINDGVVKDGYKFSESGNYISPPAGSHEDYINAIKQFPITTHPEVFGLHENAQITTLQSETRNLMETFLSIQPRSATGAGKSREEIIGDIAKSVESKTPQPFDYEDVCTRYPTQYTESMNTVLSQECIRYNRLLVLMIDQLAQVQRALLGEIVMSEDLENVANSLYDNQIPKQWGTIGFLSLKPLSNWVQDLNDRIIFLTKWIDNGTPTTFWISGFFFPQAFLTGTLQNYARKHVIAIDELSFEFKIYDDIQPTDVKEKPEDGCYVYGMFLEGARWNENTHQLDDSKPKVLYSVLPMVWFLPKQNRKVPTTGIYNCPVYKVLSRAGTLSTTGHSTNYVVMFELPSQFTENKWIVAGVAAFLALRY